MRIGRRKVERRIEDVVEREGVVGRGGGRRWEGGSGVRSEVEEIGTAAMDEEVAEEEGRSLGRRDDRMTRSQVEVDLGVSTMTAEVLLGEEASARLGKVGTGVEEEEGTTLDDEKAAGSQDEVEADDQAEEERSIGPVHVRSGGRSTGEREEVVVDERHVTVEEEGRLSEGKRVWRRVVAEGGKREVGVEEEAEAEAEAATGDARSTRELGEEVRRRPSSELASSWAARSSWVVRPSSIDPSSWE